jgi:SAM-dependent methyltransferase
MRKLDLILRNWRISKAIAHIRSGDRLLDVGCFDGHLIGKVRDRVTRAVGVDPLAEPACCGHVHIVRGAFPGTTCLEKSGFDCVTLLAVFEHLPEPAAVVEECYRVLRPGGRVVLTVPSPRVDTVLWLLERLRLADGMCTDQHYGFDVEQTVSLFCRAGFELGARRRFQLGLNNLFVFLKPVLPAGRNSSSTFIGRAENAEPLTAPVADNLGRLTSKNRDSEPLLHV